MEIGIHLPNSGPLAPDTDFVDLAQRAEASGFDAAWVYDHVLTPVEVRSSYPRAGGRYANQSSWPYFDALTTLSFVAAATSRLRIGTRVLVPVYRNPVVLAKQLATLAHLSGNRLALGVGVGWMAEEFDAVGVPLAERYERLDEHIELMRQAWIGEACEFEGRFYRHSRSGFLPRPTPSIPVLVGGFGDRTLRRVAKWGDGWAAVPEPTATDPIADLELRLARLDALCSEYGRPRSELVILGQARIADGPEPVVRMAKLGVTWCDLVPSTPGELDLRAAGEILAAVREL